MAAHVCREAGIPVLGGHSIDDPEPKFGLVAVGEVHPDRMVTNAGARAGDVLVLTKPLGTGVVATAIKAGAATAAVVRARRRLSMATLNRCRRRGRCRCRRARPAPTSRATAFWATCAS